MEATLRRHWVLWLIACVLIAFVIGTIAVWIATGDVYLKFQWPQI